MVRQRVVRRVAVVAVGVAAVAGVAVLAARAWENAWTPQHRPFDSAQWKARPQVPCDDGARQEMVQDLRENVLKRGMTEVRVRALLGKPYIRSNAEGDPGLWSTWLTSDDGIDCGTLDALFIDGRLVRTAEADT